MDRVTFIRDESTGQNTTARRSPAINQARESVPSMPLSVRTVFISDVHLGYAGCSAEFLCDFLDNTRCETLYLVGDIIDFLHLRKRSEWSSVHSEVLQKILGLTRRGT